MPIDAVSNGTERFRLAAGKSLVVTPFSPGATAVVAITTPVAGITFTSVSVTASQSIGPFAASCELIVSALGTFDVEYGLSAAQVAAVVGKSVSLASTLAGSSSGWLASAPSSERYAFQLVSGTAVVVVEGGNDALTASGALITAMLDTAGTIQSAPINHPYLYIRVTHQSGVGTVNVTRGA